MLCDNTSKTLGNYISNVSHQCSKEVEHQHVAVVQQLINEINQIGGYSLADIANECHLKVVCLRKIMQGNAPQMINYIFYRILCFYCYVCYNRDGKKLTLENCKH